MAAQQRPEINTLANLEAAFAGESMAHIKYRYFAKLAREAGDDETARTFEETANQEVALAFGHLDLLYPKADMTPARALQIAIDGETYEYTEMYPGFRKTAEAEGNAAAVCSPPAPSRSASRWAATRPARCAASIRWTTSPPSTRSCGRAPGWQSWAPA